MPLLPKPYPGEVVGSIVCRATWKNGVSYRAQLADALSTSRKSYSFLLGSNLSRLAVLSGAHLISLLKNHTVFSYASACRSPSWRETFLDRLEDNLMPTSNSFLRCVLVAGRNRYFCPTCAKEDVAEHGESYWRVEHCLPTSFACLKHSLPLQPTDIALTGFVNPTDARLPHMIATSSTRRRCSDLELAITRLGVMVQTMEIEIAESHLERYKQLALDKGFRMFDGRIDGIGLSAAMQKYFGDNMLKALGCDFSSKIAWPSLMMYKIPPVGFNTTKHVLMRQFLSDGPDALKTSSQKATPTRSKSYAFSKLDWELKRRFEYMTAKAALRRQRLSLGALLADAATHKDFIGNKMQFPLTVRWLADYEANCSQVNG